MQMSLKKRATVLVESLEGFPRPLHDLVQVTWPPRERLWHEGSHGREQCDESGETDCAACCWQEHESVQQISEPFQDTSPLLFKTPLFPSYRYSLFNRFQTACPLETFLF